MSAPPPALTTNEKNYLDSPQHMRTFVVGQPFTTVFATARVNMASISWPTGTLVVDGTSAEWLNVRAGMWVWIGSTALSKNRGVYFVGYDGTDATHIYLQPIGEPDSGSATLQDRASAIQDNDYISVFEAYGLPTGRSKIVFTYGTTSGSFYKFGNRGYVDENTKPECYFQGDGHKAYRLPTGDSTVSGSVSITGVPHRTSQSVDTYTWTVPASFTNVADDDTDTVTFDAPIGWHTLYCDVELNDGTITTAIRYVVVWDEDEAGDMPATPVTTEFSDSRDTGGRRVTVTFADDLRSQIDNEGMVLVIDEPVYKDGTVGTAITKFVGFPNTESGSIEYGKRGSSLELLGVGAVIGSLGADSQRLSQAASPANWQEAPEELMTGTYFAWYLLRWSLINWNALFCYYPPDTSLPQSVNPWDAAKGTYLSQLQNIAQRMQYCIMGFDSDGDLHIHPDPSLTDPSTRSDVVRDVLTADLITKVSYESNNRVSVRRVEVGAWIYDGTTMQAVRSEAPSNITGQSDGEEVLTNVIVDTQGELDLFAGLWFQKTNKRIKTITLTVPGNRDVAECCHGQLCQFTLIAAYSPTGATITGYGIYRQIAKQRGEDGEVYTDITIEPQTSGTPGKPYPYPPQVDNPYGFTGSDFSFSSFVPPTAPIIVQNTFSPDTAPASQIKFVLLTRNAGNTEFRVVRVDSLDPDFRATNISPTSGQRSTLGKPIRLTRLTNTKNGYILLCEDGIAYTLNASARSVTWTIAYTTSNSPITVTDDFTVSDGGWAQVPLGSNDSATYIASTGWSTADNTESPHRRRIVYIEKTIPSSTVTYVSFTYDLTKGTFTPGDKALEIIINSVSQQFVVDTSTSDATQATYVWTGSISSVTSVIIRAQSSLSDSANTWSGSALITKAIIRRTADSINISDIAVSRGGNVYWLSKADVGGTDYVFVNYTRNNFAAVNSTQVAKYDTDLTYSIQISPYNPSYIWVSAGTPGDDAAIYFSSDGAVSFTAGAVLNDRGGSYRVPRSLPNGGQNRQAKYIVYIKGINTNLQGVRDGSSAATIAAGSSDYPITSHTLNSFYLNGNYVLVGLKSRDVYKSDDGGSVWSSVSTAPGTGDLYSLEVWPSNKSYVVVGGDRCFDYSTDRAATWTNLYSDFAAWAAAEYGAGVATVILNALPVLWTVYRGVL